MTVSIRPLKIEDAYTSVKWRNDSEVFRYTGNTYDHSITIESELAWIKRVINKEDDYRCAIEVDGIYVGNIYLTDIHDGEAEYHIFLGNKEYWGKGIAKEASKLIIKYAFEKLKLKRIILLVKEENVNAVKLYIKLGFKCVKIENSWMKMELANGDKLCRVAVLASVGGGNFEAVVKKSQLYGYQVIRLIVNKQCAAIAKAEKLRVPCTVVEKKGNELFDEIDNILSAEDVDLIVLGGFMPIVPAWFCQKWHNKIINIHPSLLPAYGGKGMYGVHVQEAVMAAKEEYAGYTVHYVDEGIDCGEIIEQWKIKVDYSLTPWELGGEIYNRGIEMLPMVIGNLAKKK